MVLEAETRRLGQVDVASVPSHATIIGLAWIPPVVVPCDCQPDSWSSTCKILFLLHPAMQLRMILATSPDPSPSLVLRVQFYATLPTSPSLPSKAHRDPE